MAHPYRLIANEIDPKTEPISRFLNKQSSYQNILEYRCILDIPLSRIHADFVAINDAATWEHQERSARLVIQLVKCFQPD